MTYPLINPWQVVALGEVMHRAIETGRPLVLIVDAGMGAIMAARRVARQLAREGTDPRSFRAPHYSISLLAMRGEVLLAAGGLLLLDEVDAFQRQALAEVAGSVVATAYPPTGPALVPWICRVVALAERMGADIVDARADRPSCEVCQLGPVPGAVIGRPAICAGCRRRASENRRGVHGRGPQEWQRKVDEVDEVDEPDGPDWDAMAAARDEARGIER